MEGTVPDSTFVSFRRITSGVFSPDESGILLLFTGKSFDRLGRTNNKRYSGQREIAPNKKATLMNGFLFYIPKIRI